MNRRGPSQQWGHPLSLVLSKELLATSLEDCFEQAQRDSSCFGIMRLLGYLAGKGRDWCFKDVDEDWDSGLD